MTHDSNIDLVGANLCDELDAPFHDDPYWAISDGGRARCKIHRHPTEPRSHAQRKDTARPGETLGRLLETVRGLQHATCRGQQRCAGRSQRHSPGVPIEETHPQPLLEPLNPLGQRGLSHAQIGGRMAEMANLGYRGEEGEVSEKIHRRRR